MPVKLNSVGGGSVTMDVGSTASNFTQNLPLATTTLVGTDTTQTLTNKTLTSPTIGGTPVMGASVITSGTAVASTSGTSIDFTGIPSWAKRITVMFDGISTNGTSAFLIQLGSGSVQTSGYSGSCSNISGTGSGSASSSTSGFQTATAASAATSYNGMFTILNVTGNDYILHGQQSNTVPGSNLCGGNVGLAGKLDRVRITTVNGTDTFDAGSINILYE